LRLPEIFSAEYILTLEAAYPIPIIVPTTSRAVAFAKKIQTRGSPLLSVNLKKRFVKPFFQLKN
jgi:hypothetical protein